MDLFVQWDNVFPLLVQLKSWTVYSIVFLEHSPTNQTWTLFLQHFINILVCFAPNIISVTW